MAKPPQNGATGPASPSGARAKPSGRDARLKAALKANIARRKARAGAADMGRGAEDTGPAAAPDPVEPDGTPPHFPQDHGGAPAPLDSKKD